MAEASNSFKNCCIICKLGFDSNEPVHVTKKGVRTLLNYSEKNKRTDLCEYLEWCLCTSSFQNILVHQDCRRDFTNPKRFGKSMSTTEEVPVAKRLRSSFTPFNWKEDCMFCSKLVVVDLRHPERTKVGRVSLEEEFC